MKRRAVIPNPTLTSKRDIAKAFGIKGAARIDLKRMLKELEAEVERLLGASKAPSASQPPQEQEPQPQP